MQVTTCRCPVARAKQQSRPWSAIRSQPSAGNSSLRSPWQGRSRIKTHVMMPGFRMGDELLDSHGYQTFQTAFRILDKDMDGRLSESEAYRLVAYYSAIAGPGSSTAKATRAPVTWDLHLAATLQQAKRLDGAYNCMERFVAEKLSGGLQKDPPRLSDLVWSAVCAAGAIVALGLVAASVSSWPVVGAWHQQGLPLLLGSFGTLTVLLFGRPDADSVRPWPLIAGQLGSMAIALLVLGVAGAGLLQRAVAMGAAVAYMMWADCVHPPGGALVLVAMDSAVVQSMQWHFLLWPSLALTCAILLPMSALCCWLKRNKAFDWKDVEAAKAAADAAAGSPRQVLTKMYTRGPDKAAGERASPSWHDAWQQQQRQGRGWRDPPDIPPIQFIPKVS